MLCPTGGGGRGGPTTASTALRLFLPDLVLIGVEDFLHLFVGILSQGGAFCAEFVLAQRISLTLDFLHLFGLVFENSFHLGFLGFSQFVG